MKRKLIYKKQEAGWRPAPFFLHDPPLSAILRHYPPHTKCFV